MPTSKITNDCTLTYLKQWLVWSSISTWPKNWLSKKSSSNRTQLLPEWSKRFHFNRLASLRWEQLKTLARSKALHIKFWTNSQTFKSKTLSIVLQSICLTVMLIIRSCCNDKLYFKKVSKLYKKKTIRWSILRLISTFWRSVWFKLSSLRLTTPRIRSQVHWLLLGHHKSASTYISTRCSFTKLKFSISQTIQFWTWNSKWFCLRTPTKSDLMFTMLQIWHRMSWI